MHEDRVQKVYDFLLESVQNRGICPTKKEVALHCQSSRETVNEVLSILEMRGKITYEEGKHRSIKVL